MSLKKIPRFRNTLAFRLTLWYAGIFTVCSCIAFLLFYTLITSVTRERTDQELLSQARQFSAVLATRSLEAVEDFAVLEAQAAGDFVQKVEKAKNENNVLFFIQRGQNILFAAVTPK